MPVDTTVTGDLHGGAADGRPVIGRAPFSSINKKAAA